jgi:hypothetical protein
LVCRAQGSVGRQPDEEWTAELKICSGKIAFSLGETRSVLGNRWWPRQAAGMSDAVLAQIRWLLSANEPPELGPGPRAGVMSEQELTPKLAALFRDSKLSSPRQQLLRALILLWHDHLDASHSISQGIENADGSFVHAIMHRREPDAWNSKYWWRRVGKHQVFPEIAKRVEELLGSRRREEADTVAAGRVRLLTSAATNADLAKRLVPEGNWDAAAFVDACDSAKDEMLIHTLREIQRIETEVLIEFIGHE